MPRVRTVRTELVRTKIIMQADGGFRAVVNQQFDGKPIRRELLYAITPDEVASSGEVLMHCPSCKAIRRCDSVTLAQFGLDSLQRFSLASDSGSNAFMRVRMCRTCFYHFVTAEVSESLLLEMGENLDEKSGPPPATADAPNIIPFPKRGRRDF